MLLLCNRVGVTGGGAHEAIGEVPGPGHRADRLVRARDVGDHWEIQTLRYVPGNVLVQSPDLEMLRIFNLLDRGFDPDGAEVWMNANG